MTLGAVFDENQKNLTSEEHIKIYEDVQKQMQATHPGFSIQLIIVGAKAMDLAMVDKKLQEAVKQKAAFPHMIAGFDLVMEEDSNK